MLKVLSSPMILRAACVAGIVLFLLRALAFWAGDGMFYSFGVDYAICGAAAEVATRSSWAAIYDTEALTRAFAGWLAAGLDRGDPATFAAFPYPAPHLLPFFLTNMLGHVGGFAAWTILNIVLYAAIVRGLAGADRRDPLMSLAPFAFLPFLFDLYIGQTVVLLAFGLDRALQAFDEGRERAAGCWLGLLLVKPQIGLIMVPVLLVRRRWSALAGLTLVGAGLAASTVLLAGADGVRDYLALARSFSGFRQVPRIVYPWDMINVRGLLVQLLPASCGEAQGLRMVHLLSAALLLALIPVWRGPWNPRGARFARQVLATMIVALVAGFHSHIHAAVLLIPPLLAALRERRDADPLRGLSVLLFFLPTFSVALNGNLVQGAWLLMILMAGMLGSIAAERDHDGAPFAILVRGQVPGAAISPGVLTR
jgi:hypothetical protein